MSLESITFGTGLTTVPGGTFFDCFKLNEVILRGNVTSIGSTAFQNCTGLKNFTIPASVTSIGQQAFINCGSLTDVTILRPSSSGVISAGYLIFDFCTSLVNIKVPDANSVTAYKTAWSVYANLIKVA